MSKTETTFETWEEVILDFFQQKCDVEEEKYLKDEVKRAEELYSEVNFLNDDEIKLIFNTKKYKKNKDETSLNFQRRRASTLFKKTPENINRFQMLKEYARKRKDISIKYNSKNWFSTYCNNASSVSFATHVIKLTHSKIDTPSIFDKINEVKNEYMTTSALTAKVIDGAVSGNQFAPIFQFLELELNGTKLAEQLARDGQIFNVFVQNDENNKELVEKWTSGFRKALDSGMPATHALAKQVYFPINNKSHEYHLLCNIVSSSLAQTVHERVFDDDQKLIKKSFEKRKFQQGEHIIFPQRSHLNVTASNHSNASQLNGKRGGKLHLFSSQPPTWQSQLRPPVNRLSLFDNLYNATIKTEIDYLRDFLLRFKQLNLSIKNPKRKRHLERWVNNIIDEFLFYISTIQSLPAGWSEQENIRLKKAQQYLLDPYRNDETFQSARQNEDWLKVIRDDFARWLNRRLQGKDKQFTPKAEHSKLWKKLLEQPLREHIEQINQEIKQKEGEVV